MKSARLNDFIRQIRFKLQRWEDAAFGIRFDGFVRLSEYAGYFWMSSMALKPVRFRYVLQPEQMQSLCQFATEYHLAPGDVIRLELDEAFEYHGWTWKGKLDLNAFQWQQIQEVFNPKEEL